jgi:hypothetical protein
MRHMAAGGGIIAKLSDLRGPMSTIFEQLGHELAELQRYRAMYGPLDARDRVDDHNDHTATPSEGSDTEQE